MFSDDTIWSLRSLIGAGLKGSIDHQVRTLISAILMSTGEIRRTYSHGVTIYKGVADRGGRYVATVDGKKLRVRSDGGAYTVTVTDVLKVCESVPSSSDIVMKKLAEAELLKKQQQDDLDALELLKKQIEQMDAAKSSKAVLEEFAVGDMVAMKDGAFSKATPGSEVWGMVTSFDSNGDAVVMKSGSNMLAGTPDGWKDGKIPKWLGSEYEGVLEVESYHSGKDVVKTYRVKNTSFASTEKVKSAAQRLGAKEMGIKADGGYSRVTITWPSKPKVPQITDLIVTAIQPTCDGLKLEKQHGGSQWYKVLDSCKVKPARILTELRKLVGIGGVVNTMSPKSYCAVWPSDVVDKTSPAMVIAKANGKQNPPLFGSSTSLKEPIIWGQGEADIVTPLPDPKLNFQNKATVYLYRADQLDARNDGVTWLKSAISCHLESQPDLLNRRTVITIHSNELEGEYRLRPFGKAWRIDPLNVPKPEAAKPKKNFFSGPKRRAMK